MTRVLDLTIEEKVEGLRIGYRLYLAGLGEGGFRDGYIEYLGAMTREPGLPSGDLSEPRRLVAGSGVKARIRAPYSF
jgi:hypothetical protein